MSAEIRYTAKVTGDVAPFKWEVRRYVPASATASTNPQNCRGQADTFEEALLDAAFAAKRSEDERRHGATAREEDLFTVPALPPITASPVPEDLRKALEQQVFGD